MVAVLELVHFPVALLMLPLVFPAGAAAPIVVGASLHYQPLVAGWIQQG